MDEFTKQKVTELKKAVKTLQDQARNVKKNDNTHGLIEVIHPELTQSCLGIADESVLSESSAQHGHSSCVVEHRVQRGKRSQLACRRQSR